MSKPLEGTWVGEREEAGGTIPLGVLFLRGHQVASGDRWEFPGGERGFSAHTDRHPYIPLILDVEWAKSSVLKAEQILRINHGSAELRARQKVKKVSESALWLVAGGGLLCWFGRPGNWGPEIFRHPLLIRRSAPVGNDSLHYHTNLNIKSAL